MRNYLHITLTPLFLLAFIATSTMASAAPELSISTLVEKDVQRVDENGQSRVERVEAADVAPGETLYFTLTYRNSGDTAATNVKLDNPVSGDTVYVPGSAWGEGSEILFSIDGGETYKKAAALTYQVDSQTRTAEPEQYNAVRWIVGEIPAGEQGSVGFSARVK